MKVLYVASVTEEIVADSILDTAQVAIRTIQDVTQYAAQHGLEVFKVTVEKVPR